MPEDANKRNEILFSAIQGGADLAQLPEYYVPLHGQRERMIKRLRPMEELRKLNEMSDADWQSLLVRYESSEDNLGYLPLVANSKDGAVILDRRTGDILETVMLTPSFGGLTRSPRDSLLPNG